MSAEAYLHWRAHGGAFDLSARTKLRLTGADRVRYLNGQVTADVKKLRPGVALPAVITTAKGKLCGELHVTATDDALWIDADESLRESLPARLERYIVADDVLVEDVSDRFSLLHFTGPTAAMETLAASAPPGLLVRSNRFGVPGWDLRPEENPPVQRDAVSVGGGSPFQVLPPDLAEIIRIEAGVPRWGRELDEERLPPEAGLDRTHIDYHKGCYIGQEVISRLKSVGHVNRQLTGFIALGETALQPGWLLFASTADERPAGEITSAVHSFALAKPVALGYLRRGTPAGALLAGPADRSSPPVEVTPAALPLVTHFSSLP